MRIQNTQNARRNSTTNRAASPIHKPPLQPYTCQPATAQPTATGSPSSTAARYSHSPSLCRPRQAEVKLQMQNPIYLKSAAQGLRDRLDELFGKDRMPLCKAAVMKFERSV